MIKEAEFISSVDHVEKCPKQELPEYALIGRSNVGKSSLLNMLTKRQKLAKVSSTPGKTQTINHFLINGSYFIVDLPGYGFAKVSKKSREKFNRMSEEYLLKRKTLSCVLVLVDSRHPLQAIDASFMEWCGENQVPFVIVFTKVDKLSSGELEKNVAAINEELLKTWEELPQTFLTSSEKKVGGEELVQFFEQTNNEISKFHTAIN